MDYTVCPREELCFHKHLVMLFSMLSILLVCPNCQPFFMLLSHSGEPYPSTQPSNLSLVSFLSPCFMKQHPDTSSPTFHLFPAIPNHLYVMLDGRVSSTQAVPDLISFFRISGPSIKPPLPSTPLPLSGGVGEFSLLLVPR